MAILTHHRLLKPAWIRPWALSALPVLLMLAALAPAPAAVAQSREYQLKAAFLANFAQYVEWPEQAFSSEDAPFVFGVLGENPFGGALKGFVDGERVNGRKAVVEEYKSVREISRCHVLFVSDSERPRLPAIMRALKGRSILTVSNIDDFNEQGGMIRFVTQNRVRFRINVTAAGEANLKFSSKLLRLADAVDSAKAK